MLDIGGSAGAGGVYEIAQNTTGGAAGAAGVNRTAALQNEEITVPGQSNTVNLQTVGGVALSFSVFDLLKLGAAGLELIFAPIGGRAPGVSKIAAKKAPPRVY